jgi:Flp pilus assembly protein TadG
MPRSRQLFRRLADCTGSNVLEAAIITPLLLVLTFSIIDFASLFYVYLSLENGVSQATRYAVTGNVMDDPDNPGGQLSREGSIMAAMKGATPTLELTSDAFSFTHMTPGSSSWSSGVGGPSDVGRVTIDYTWKPLTPILRPFLTNGEIHVSVDSAMKNEARFE